LANETSFVNGRTCGDKKANGGSAMESRTPDSFYIDVLAHEISHQFNAGHTWSGASYHRFECEEIEFHKSSAVEPGSGSTIMGYGGKCGDFNDIQDANDPYFALVSLEQIHRFALNIFDEGKCGLAAPNVEAPKISPQAGFPQGKCQVPKRTGFVLAPNIDDIILSSKQGLSYSWEQADLATGRRLLRLGRSFETGPMFRSQVPIDQPVRYFPSLARAFTTEYIPGEPNSWPIRNFQFSLTVRDMWQLGGGSATAQGDVNTGRGSFAAEYVQVSVVDVDPFEVDADASSDETIITVTWTKSESVARLLPDNGAASSAKVSVSFDNGVTFSNPTMFSFADGEAIVPVKACPDGVIKYDRVAVLVEVVSVTGCGFYAVKSLAPMDCPENPLPTTTPTGNPTESPTFTPTFTPTGNPTFSPSYVPTESPTDSPTDGSKDKGGNDDMTTIIIAASVAGVLSVGAAGAIIMSMNKAVSEKKSGGNGGPSGRRTSFNSLVNTRK
jgi:hypothetical protein